MDFTTIFLTIFIYGFWIMFGVGLIGLKKFDKPPEKKTFRNLIKRYWSEVFLITCMIIVAHFFVRGVINP